MIKRTDWQERGKRRREAIVHAIRGYTREHGYPPSIREIGKMVGLNSTSAVVYQLSKLEEQGILDRGGEKGSARTVRVTHEDPRW